ncbi:MAG TPA: cytochrome c3 family protein [Candidatus Deferrimicrobium sp.]|nr:cytochrome c3 family protein [Candidatus Deferrimicrobium sp.]
MVHDAEKHAVSGAPDTLVIDVLSKLYGPVRFEHKLHAGMSQMGRGCGECHHYSPAGEIPSCRSCHQPGSDAADLSKPGLKGAYHRQCLACHREWSHETQCVLCHSQLTPDSLAVRVADPTDIMGTTHPVITVPAKRVYQTPYQPGAMVTFQHKEHIELFALRCVDCHRRENCGNCHDLQKRPQAARSQEEVHGICNDCHKSDACAKCHDVHERPQFSHNTTGWPLSRYHQNLDCRACHPTGRRIGALDPACVTCHGGWSPANFRHAVTGLQLDEIHAQAECQDCHAERAFDAKPTCAGCHDDGRTAETAPPGTRVPIGGP